MTDEELNQQTIRQITPEMKAEEDRAIKQQFLAFDLDKARGSITYCLDKCLTIPFDWVEKYNKTLKEIVELNG